MAQFQNAVQDGGDEDVSPDQFSRELDEMLDANPTLLDEFDAVLDDGVDEEQPSSPAQIQKQDRLARLWEWTKEQGRALDAPNPRALRLIGTNLDTHVVNNVADAAMRGGLKAVNEFSNTAIGGLVTASKATGAFKVGRTADEEKAFLDWWRQPTRDANALQIPEDKITKWYGPAKGGLLGFTEGASQFAAGMTAAGSYMKGFAWFKKLGELGKLGKLAQGSITGAEADFTFFDPHQQRISDLIQNGPEAFRNPITAFLANDIDDTELEGRLKNAVEGSVLGATLDAIVLGAKAVRARARGDMKGFVEALTTEPKPNTDLVTVVDTPEGAQVVPNGISKTQRVFLKKELGFTDAQIDQLKESMDDFDAETTPLKIQRDENMKKFAAENAAKERVTAAAIRMPNGAVATGFNHGEVMANAIDDGVFPDSEAAGAYMRVNPSARGFATNTRKFVSPDEAAEIAGRKGERITAEEIVDEEPVPIRTGGMPDGSPVPTMALDAVAPDGPIFQTRAEAENVAATINYKDKLDATPKGAESVLDPESVAAWKKLSQAYAEGKDPRDAAQILEDTGINVNHVQSPDEVIAQVKALVDLLPDPSTITRAKTRTWAEAAKNAEGMFPGMDGNQMLEAAQRIFGKVENLDAEMFALRTWTWMHANVVRKLSAAVEANPSNALALDELAKGLDTMLDLHAHVSGTSTNVARALAIHRMPVGEGVDEAVKAAASTTDEAVQAEAKALGADAPVVEEAAAGGAKANGKAPKPPTFDDRLGNKLEAHGPSRTPGNAVLASPAHRAPTTHKATAGLSRTEIRALARTIFMTEGDPSAILAVLRAPKGKAPKGVDPTKWYNWIISLRMEAMLSGPKTQVTNMVNNAIVMFQRPAEYWWGGARTGRADLQQFGADMLGGLWENARESWAVTKKSFAAGENILDPGNTHTGQGLKPWENASWLSRIAHAPSRFLMSGDEFFKQMNYRGNLRAQILQKARLEGVRDAGELARRLKEDMQFAFDPEGGAVNPVALNYSRVGTFTNELEYGIGKSLQDAVQKNPALRIIFPFVRTPTNIFRYHWERAPGLNFLNRQFRADWAAGGERRAVAQAKLEMGVAMYSMAGMLAYGKFITGRGPADPQLRQQMKDTKTFVPYSVKIPGTNQWVSYRRGDPFFTSLGIVADLVQASGEMDNDTIDEKASMLVASIMANLSNKTYMQGATQFFEAMASGRGDVVSNLMSSTVASFIPNVLRQTNPDDMNRETRGLVDELLARLPGFSETLEARRNLFGEKIMRPPGYLNNALNPFTIAGTVEDGDVADELVKVGRAFSMPSEKRGLIDLTDRETFADRNGQSPYDRMLEIMSAPPGGMPTLRASLTNLVKSDLWKQIHGEDAYGPGGMKHTQANTIIQAYQQIAWAQVLSEYPTLQKAAQQEADLKAHGTVEGRVGIQSVMDKYERLFVKPRS